jgi:hypothetical protein
MLLLSQTLPSLEKQWALKQEATAGDDYHLDKCGLTGPLEEEKREEEERQRHCIPKREFQFWIPTGDQEVPSYDPKWDPENDKDEWTCNHFIHCILEGWRRAKINPLITPKSWLYSKDP